MANSWLTPKTLNRITAYSASLLIKSSKLATQAPLELEKAQISLTWLMKITPVRQPPCLVSHHEQIGSQIARISNTGLVLSKTHNSYR